MYLSIPSALKLKLKLKLNSNFFSFSADQNVLGSTDKISILEFLATFEGDFFHVSCFLLQNMHITGA